MSKTLETLGGQHQEVLAYLERISGDLSGKGARPDLATFHAFLAGEVIDHFNVEERALFPVMARYPHLAEGPLVVMNSEHARFRALLDGIAAALQAGDAALQRRHAEDLINLLRGHISKEDGVLFPMALRTLTPDELSEVDVVAGSLGPSEAGREA